MVEKDQNQYFLNCLIDGESEGILSIYRQIFPKVNQYILTNGGQLADARDIFQMALLQLSMRARSKDFVLNSTFEGYLFTICKNLWRRENKINKIKVTTDDISSLATRRDDITDATIEQEKWELFQEKLQGISENCRNILTFYFRKMNYKDIAKALGYSNDNVVRQRIFKCKKKLKDSIQTDSRYKEIKGL